MTLSTALDMVGWLAKETKSPVLPKPRIVETRYQAVSGECLECLRDQKVIGLDLETTGLNPLGDRIRLISLASAAGTTVLDANVHQEWPRTIRDVLADPLVTKVFHNAKFDLQFLAEAGVEVSGVADTMLLAQVLDGGLHLRDRGWFTLESVVRRELGETLDKSLQASDWSDDRLTQEQLSYAAHDATVLIPLYEALRGKLEPARLINVASLEHTALPALVWLERTGAPFDVRQWMSLSDAAMARKLRIAAEISVVAGGDINLNSPAQVKRMLGSLGIEAQGTGENVLSALVDRHPVVPKLLEYREASKLATVYGIQFLKHVHQTTGRIHPQYRQIGASTGRMSCSGPNLQQIPGDPAYRGCFRPARGRVLVKADLSLIELCVAAELSGDDRMVEAIATRQDLHRITAAALFGIEQDTVTPDQRRFGKAVNFGALYGQGRRGLIELAARHGLTLSEDEARTFQQRFASAWPELIRWQRQQMNGRGTLVRTASGRMRQLEHGASGTIRANTPVQGTAADGFKAALARLWNTRHRCPSAVPVLAVHDELVIECDADDADDAAAWVSECLELGMRQYLKRVLVRVEVKVCADWSGGAIEVQAP